MITNISEIELTEKQKSLINKLVSDECEPHNSYLGITLCHNPKQCQEAIELFKEFREFPTIYRTAGGYTPRCIYDVLNKDSACRGYLKEGLQ